jgi:hypothetical protein
MMTDTERLTIAKLVQAIRYYLATATKDRSHTNGLAATSRCGGAL